MASLLPKLLTLKIFLLPASLTIRLNKTVSVHGHSQNNYKWLFLIFLAFGRTQSTKPIKYLIPSPMLNPSLAPPNFLQYICVRHGRKTECGLLLYARVALKCH